MYVDCMCAPRMHNQFHGTILARPQPECDWPGSAMLHMTGQGGLLLVGARQGSDWQWKVCVAHWWTHIIPGLHLGGFQFMPR